MRIRKLGAVIGLGVLGPAVALAGCASEDDPAAGFWASDDGSELELRKDGGFSGTDGCNLLTGTWSTRNEDVVFESGAMTLKECVGVDAWLSELASGSIDGHTMIVFDERGREIGALDRS